MQEAGWPPQRAPERIQVRYEHHRVAGLLIQRDRSAAEVTIALHSLELQDMLKT